MKVLAIIVAAGQGVRMGARRPKAYLDLGGRTLLERSLAPFLSHPRVERVLAATPDPDEARRILGEAAGRAVLVRGGATRQESVLCALRAAPPGGSEVVLIHDAARPLVPRALIDAVLVAAERDGAAVPGLVPPDTVKQVDGTGGIAVTLDRDGLRLAQTPQGLRGDLLRAAYARPEREGEDRAERQCLLGTAAGSLVERTGRRGSPVQGSPRNIKITTAVDPALAHAIRAREDSGD